MTTAARDIRTCSLLDFVPESISDDPEVIALSQAVDPELQAVAVATLEAIIWPNIAAQPEAVLDAMGWDLRLSELRAWDLLTVAGKKAALAGALIARKRAGTRYSVELFANLLSLVIEIVEWWETGGSGEPYTYDVVIDADATAVGLVTLERLLALYEILQRFTPTRASLTDGQMTIEVSSAGEVTPVAGLTVGHFHTIPFSSGA